VGSIAIPVATVLVLVWVRTSGTPWRDIGFARPRSSLSVVATGTVFGCVLKLTMKALVMPLVGADPVNPTYHYPDQGWTGAEQALVTGLVFGTIFARTGRIWMLMCTHAAYDLTAVALIYANLESGVAHLVFK
jgi:hypothetical protein